MLSYTGQIRRKVVSRRRRVAGYIDHCIILLEIKTKKWKTAGSVSQLVLVIMIIAVSFLFFFAFVISAGFSYGLFFQIEIRDFFN